MKKPIQMNEYAHQPNYLFMLSYFSRRNKPRNS